MASLTSFEKWQDGINRAAGNPQWDVWDCEIQLATREYNHHLSGIAGYRDLDWKLIKAMIWVETGAESKKWKTNPIQIGNPGDPGLRSLLTGNEGGELIVPPSWKNRLTAGTAATIPAHNIRAGIGYLLMRTANYSFKSVPESDDIHETKVKAGDSIAKIAKENGSTMEIIKKLNQNANILQPGQLLKYQKASTRKYISSWDLITSSSIARKYNVGDPMYAKKLDYALSKIRKGSFGLCTF